MVIILVLMLSRQSKINKRFVQGQKENVGRKNSDGLYMLVIVLHEAVIIQEKSILLNVEFHV